MVFLDYGILICGHIHLNLRRKSNGQKTPFSVFFKLLTRIIGYTHKTSQAVVSRLV